jgi:taurine dioxygenase
VLQVRPREDGFGAEVRGVRLAGPPAAGDAAAVLAALAEHKVLWFPDQPLTIDEQEAFTASLGAFGEDPFIEALPGHPHVLELRREANETAPNFGAGWHSDWSFMAHPPLATLLHSKVVPPVGGDTLFADCGAVYESFSPAFRQLLDGLTAVHSARMPYGREGVYARETSKRSIKINTGEAAEAEQLHPLVRVNPVTGERSVFASPVYTVGLEGMTADEGYAILMFIFKRMEEPRFILRHKWQPNMLLMWDNRQVNHFADGGYDGHLRVMHRTTLAGDAPIGVRSSG